MHRSRGPHGFFCLQVVRRVPVIVDVIRHDAGCFAIGNFVLSSPTNESPWTRQRLGGLPRLVSVAYWSVIATIAGVSVFLVWPEPYMFRVSQTTFQAVEEIDGEWVPLDDYQTGFKKLEAFNRKCQIVCCLSGAFGACIAHLIASLVAGRDVSISITLTAIPLIMIGIWIAAAIVPETVDPVYGNGGPMWFGFGFYMLVFFFTATVAAAIEFCLLAIRWVIGRCILVASIMPMVNL